MTRVLHLRTGAYQDSISLMQVSRDIAARADVRTALVAMATELNLDLLSGLGFTPPEGASPNDMVVAVDADDDTAAEAAVTAVDEQLARRPTTSDIGSSRPAPRTVGAAARRAPASLALVSTPGRVAAIDAADALAAGLDVMVFSDNVALEQEVRLKQLADASGLLVMGPDCGTAVVDGVGLGFANVVRPGRVGVVAASGTGAQQMLTLLAGAGVGVKHCWGVGGRDLSAEVGGRSTLAALDQLAADDDIDVVVVLSKPPDDDVAAKVTAHAESLDTTVLTGYLGPGRPDLTATAARVVEAAGGVWATPGRWGPAARPADGEGFVRGLFSGGTLCDEAMLIAVEALGEVASNIPLAGQPALGEAMESTGHTFIDFGDDRLTAGRPHPMIDGSLRLERLATELADPACAAVLLDVVLGLAAHPDPAAELCPVIGAAEKPVLVTVVGTRDDPQGLQRTIDALTGAGAVVHASNAAAAHEAVDLVRSPR